jgi:transcriptional regulator with XRE-family HTH domain
MKLLTTNTQDFDPAGERQPFLQDVDAANAGRRSAVAQPVDVHVGREIRFRRKLLKLSQSELGAKVGVTFQQMQKYEKGHNRVGASRLAAIAKALNCPVGDFFPHDDRVLSVSADFAARLADLETRLATILEELKQLRRYV